VQLLEANPQFSRVLFPDGRESTVSTSDLEPSGQQEIALDQKLDETESSPEFPLPSQQTETVTPDGGRSSETEHTARALRTTEPNPRSLTIPYIRARLCHFTFPLA